MDKYSEAQILKRIKDMLPLYCREVIWIDRLQSGMVKHENYYVNLCKKGTPDLYAILNVFGGQLLFIEVKAPKGRQTPEQKAFQLKLEGLKNVHYVLARSLADVTNFIRENIVNYHRKEA